MVQKKINTSHPRHRKKIMLMGHADGIGGAQTAFLKLYDFVQKEGHDIKLVCLFEHKAGSLSFKKNVIIGKIIYKGERLKFHIKKVADLVCTGIRARRYQPDIFVAVGLNNSSNLIARFVGTNCYKIGQDFIANRPADDPLWLKSINQMDAIAVQSPSMLNFIDRPSQSVCLINWLPCFPETPESSVCKEAASISTNNTKIAYFGRLAGNKGLPLLIKAFTSAAIPKNVILHIWGKGPEEARLKELIKKLGLEAQVFLFGSYPMPSAGGAALMASYDALVLCSTNSEGLPLILLEAMAYGLPFMATDIGAIRDCCLDNPDALLVKPTDAGVREGLATLIAKLHNNEFNPERQRNYYQNRFSYTNMANRWRECFQDPQSFFTAKEEMAEQKHFVSL